MLPIFSTCYILVTIFCIISGVYILYLNHNERMNKISFFICMSIACMTFGIFRTMNAANMEDAINWRRFSEIGALFMFALFLDFILTITIKETVKNSFLLKTLPYLPTTILIYIMSVSKNLTNQIYHYEKSANGWISIPRISNWKILCTSYVIMTLVIGFIFLMNWYKKSQSSENNITKQSRIILFAYELCVVMLFFGQVSFYLLKIPYVHETLPLFVPVPMICVYFAVRKYQFMQVRYEDIIMERFRSKIMKYLPVGYFIGGIIYLGTQYSISSNKEILPLMGIVLIFCFFGITIYLTQKFNQNERISLFVFSIILTVTVPIVALRFMESSANTVWTFSFIIIIASVLLYDSAIFIMITASTIMTQLYLWIFIPQNNIILDDTDFFGRILIFGFAAFLVNYINKVYVKRLKELSSNMKEQDLLFQVTNRLMDMNSSNKKEKIQEIMDLIGTSMEAERVFFYSKPMDTKVTEEYIKWENHVYQDGTTSGEQELYEMPWWKQSVRENGLIRIEDVQLLPKSASQEIKVLTEQKAQGVIAVPMNGSGIRTGFIRVDFTAKKMQDVTNTEKTLGTIANILGKAEDKIRVELELENMAYYDQLTKIPNRFLFGKYVKQRIAHSNKVNGAFCILFLDIDSFKNINDTSGHHYGDMVLVKAAENISRCIRKTDVICRFGGDEFLILLHYANNKEDVERVAEKILEVIQEPIVINEKEINITASMGISVFPEDGTDKDTLIKNADIAMYKAKNFGKNRFIFCTEEMKNEISKEIALTSHLHRALEKGELSLVYQPQVQTQDSRVVAAEALLRWTNPVLGTISPGVFIPIAEKNGYIIPIGEWVLSEACKQNKIWQNQGLPKIRVAVNVSVNQLNQGNFPEIVKKILDKVKLEPQYLEIEITESVAMEKSEIIMNSLYKLKELGVSIAIDDFGTEYSSLNRIKDLPVDRIKLDIQFIRNILINEKEREITDAIISLAKKLNLAVIAEGVEEKEQFLYLKNKNCDEVQGYYFYRPLSWMDLENLLRKMSV